MTKEMWTSGLQLVFAAPHHYSSPVYCETTGIGCRLLVELAARGLGHRILEHERIDGRRTGQAVQSLCSRSQHSATAQPGAVCSDGYAARGRAHGC